MNSRPTADRFRDAIRRGSYDDAERLLEELRYDVEAVWKTAVSREQRREIATEVTGLLDWARQTVSASRSHTQSKLVQLNRQRTYLVTGTERREHFHVEG